MRCYIYVIGPEHGPYKVGIAGDPWGRLCDLQVANWNVLVIHALHAIPADADPLGVESRVHASLKRSSIRGEWFDGTPAAISRAILAVLDSPPMSQEAKARHTVLTLHPLAKAASE